MNELHIDKSHWKKYRFDEVCRQVNEATKDPQAEGLDHVIGLEHIEPNNLHITQWDTLEKETTFTRKFRKGQVLFGRRRAYQRKVAYAEFDGICSGDILVFEAIEDVLLPELLPFLIQSEGFFQKALATSAGSLSPRTKFKELADYEFLLPPKAEQKRLAELLWAADEVVEKEKRERENMERFIRTQLIQIGNHKGDSQLTINNVCDILDNKRKPLSSRERDAIKGDYPYYGVNGIVDYINTYIFDDELVLLAEDCGNYQNYKEEPIAYLITGKSWINNHVHVLKAKKDMILSKWLYYSLAHKDIVRFINGSTRGKLCSSELERITIYVPSIEKQRVLCVDIEQNEKALELVKSQLNISQQIKQELIDKVF